MTGTADGFIETTLATYEQAGAVVGHPPYEDERGRMLIRIHHNTGPNVWMYNEPLRNQLLLIALESVTDMPPPALFVFDAESDVDLTFSVRRKKLTKVLAAINKAFDEFDDWPDSLEGARAERRAMAAFD